MATLCPVPLHVCATRATLLDNLGNVHSGSNNSYVSDKVFQVQVTPVLLTGADIEQKGGCDQLLATWKAPNYLKRFQIQIDQGALEPAMEALLFGATALLASANHIGLDYPLISTVPPLVAIEFWTENIEDDHLDPVYPYSHWVFPAAQWAPGQNTFGDAFAQPKITGETKSNPQWGHGPYGDQGGQIFQVGGYVFVNTIPTSACALATIAPSS